MPTDFAFRLSTYLTLALACGGLAYAEAGYLPEAAVFGALVVVAIGLSFWADRSGRSLSLGAADWVGGGLFALTLGWIGYNIFAHHPVLNTWPAGLLPFLGPVLMLATVAKLCRPKHVGDWWALQVIGLCSIALAAALTDDEPFVPVLFLYLLVLGWSLTLFFIRRASGYVDPVPEYTHFQARAVRWLLAAISPKLGEVPPPHRPTVAAPFAGVGQPTPTERLGRSHLARAAGWMTVAAVVALPLFLVTPRTAGLQWELFKPRLEVGLPTDSTLDLSRTGELQPNDEPAFEVTARYPDGRPKELPGTARWRVSAYCRYVEKKGQWEKLQAGSGVDGNVVTVAMQNWAVEPDQPRPVFPDLGPGQFLLEYQLFRALGGMPLLDPVAVRAGQPPTVVHPMDGGYRYPNMLKDGSFHHFMARGGQTAGGAKLTRYLQLSAVGPDDDLSGPFPGPDTPLAERLKSYLADPPDQIKTLAKSIYLGLIESGRLPAGVRERWRPGTLWPADADHAAVARAVRDHLAGSGRYQYTLNLRVQNKTIDPVEDFLLNTREGHCERFAAALVLLLRGLGIPCQFVVGFKGCEPLDDGRYLVRQEHAHAWAEVLVWQPSGRPRENGTDGRDWYWLSLDPTPDTSSADELERTKSAASDGRRLIADLLLGLNPERQRQLAEAAADLGRRYGPATAGGLLAVGLLVVVYLVYRRVGRRAAAVEGAPTDDAPWFARLVEVLTAAGVPPPAGRTPKEYAAAAAAQLSADTRTTGVADVPPLLAELVYATRYAGRPPSSDELAAADAALARLASALASRTP